MESKILDYNERLESDHVWRESFQWWEKKRLIYNVVVGLTGLVVLLLFAFRFGFFDIINILIYGAVANVFYSVGFLVECIDKYYFKGKLNIHLGRWAFFIIGLMFSCAVTFAGCLLFYSFM